MELIQQIMHLLPFKCSEALSQGCSGTPALNPYAFYEPCDETYELFESVIKAYNIPALKGLLANCKIQLDGSSVMSMAVDQGYWKTVALLLQDSRVDPTAQDNLAFRKAAEKGRIAIVEILLEDPRVDPSAYDNYAILLAAFNGHEEIVKILLQDPRVNPSAQDNLAILKAA